MAGSVRQYESILGISSASSTDEIKKAFRSKAKQLHPDVNKNVDAHEQFILLQEAYDYFLNRKQGNNKSENDTAINYEVWVNQRREQARERARAYARMKYDEYLKSEDFKAVSALNVVFDFIGFLIILLLLAGIPVFISLIYGVPGLIVCVLALLLSIKYVIRLIRLTVPDFSGLPDSVSYIIKTSEFQIVFITLLNLFLIMKIGFSTLIDTKWLFLSLIIPSVVVYFFQKLIDIRNKTWAFASWFCIAPLIINLLFVINYSFSSEPVSETYNFKRSLQNTFRGKRETTTILLEQNKYSEYYFLRFFMESSDIGNNSRITYTFKNGLLGFRVCTGYEFKE
jgi:hypothetical protein